jgi:DNA-binding transcriptional MerR regulator
MGFEMDETTTPALRTVAEVADLVGITVRTLHHYDSIGLLVPSARSEAEYRLYDAADLARLREILVWRRLDVPLAQIAQLLDDPATDRLAVLRAQRELVATRQQELTALAAALDRALEREATTGDDSMTDQDIIDALDGFDPRDHEAEVVERWGDTEAYRQSARRTKAYGPEQWREIKAEAEAIAARLAELFTQGEPADGTTAMDAAEAHRLHITRRFYDCSPEMHRGLGEMYVGDPRFTANWDERAPGLAAFVRDAFVANAERQSLPGERAGR